MAVELISPTGVAVKLEDILSIDIGTGFLTWRERPSSLFQTARDWKKWNTRYAGQPALRYSHGGGRQFGQIFNRVHSAHRVVWALVHDEWPGGFIDHIDGNPANNQPSNLRVVTNQENMRNASKRKDNTSGVPGVCWDQRRNKWYARIGNGTGAKFLGYFEKIEDAREARESAKIALGYHPNHDRHGHAAVAASNASP